MGLTAGFAIGMQNKILRRADELTLTLRQVLFLVFGEVSDPLALIVTLHLSTSADGLF